jgi:hypothetical protein
VLFCLSGLCSCNTTVYSLVFDVGREQLHEPKMFICKISCLFLFCKLATSVFYKYEKESIGVTLAPPKYVKSVMHKEGVLFCVAVWGWFPCGGLKGELCLMLMVIVEFQQLAAVSDLEICETVTFQDLVRSH